MSMLSTNEPPMRSETPTVSRCDVNEDKIENLEISSRDNTKQMNRMEGKLDIHLQDHGYNIDALNQRLNGYNPRPPDGAMLKDIRQQKEIKEGFTIKGFISAKNAMKFLCLIIAAASGGAAISWIMKILGVG